MREFETGATRNSDEGKLDYEGFFSPLVLKRRAEYMHKHRFQENGELRTSDNWQKGIPHKAYMKSAWRHFMDWWSIHRLPSRNLDISLEDSICALIFNAEGYLHELLRRKPEVIDCGRDPGDETASCWRCGETPCPDPCTDLKPTPKTILFSEWVAKTPQWWSRCG